MTGLSVFYAIQGIRDWGRCPGLTFWLYESKLTYLALTVVNLGPLVKDKNAYIWLERANYTN